jgi:hypothetical protein
MRLAVLSVLLLAACGNPDVEVKDLNGKWGSNSITLIKIDPSAPCPKGTYAQELWEALAKRDPVTYLSIRSDSSAQRQFEITGHEVEVQAAVEFCAVDEDEYRKREANTMHRGYDGLFKKSSPEDIEARMKRETKDAAKWVKENRRTLDKLKV